MFDKTAAEEATEWGASVRKWVGQISITGINWAFLYPSGFENKMRILSWDSFLSKVRFSSVAFPCEVVIKGYLVLPIWSLQIIPFSSLANESSLDLINRRDRDFIMCDQSDSSFLFYALVCTILVILPLVAFCWLAKRQKDRRLEAAQGTSSFRVQIHLDRGIANEMFNKWAIIERMIH